MRRLSYSCGNSTGGLIEPLVGWIRLLVDRVDRFLLPLFQIRCGLICYHRLMSSHTVYVGASGKCHDTDYREHYDGSQIVCFADYY
jgi:hypothetical protein